MTSFDAITAGLRSARDNKAIVSIFYACNLFLAAAVAAPMYAAISDHLGNSAMSNTLAAGFSGPWLTEFQIAYSEFLRAFSIQVVYAGIVFLALNTVLSGGAFEVFAGGDEAGVLSFGRGIGRYFGRFARIAAIASVFYFLAFWLFNYGVARAITLAYKNSLTESWPFALQLVRVALLIFCVSVINAIVDYARADVVRDQHSSALAALGHAAGFVFSHLGRVMFIYFFLGLLSVMVVLAYSVFAHLMPEHSVATIFIWFVVAQALMWVRWMLRLASWAAAAHFLGVRLPLAPADEPLLNTASLTS